MNTASYPALRLVALSVSLFFLATTGWTADPVAPLDGNTPLHRAVLRGDEAAVENLL